MSVSMDMLGVWGDICHAIDLNSRERVIKSFTEPISQDEKSLDDLVMKRFAEIPFDGKSKKWTELILEQYRKSGILSAAYLLTQAINRNDDNAIENLVARMEEAYQQLNQCLREITPEQKKAKEFADYIESIKVGKVGESLLARVTVNPILDAVEILGQARIYKMPVRRMLRYGKDYLEFNSIMERYSQGKAWSVRKCIDRLMLFVEAYKAIMTVQEEEKGRKLQDRSNIIITPRESRYRGRYSSIVVVNSNRIEFIESMTPVNESSSVDYSGTRAEIVKAFLGKVFDERDQPVTHAAIFMPRQDVNLDVLSWNMRYEQFRALVTGRDYKPLRVNGLGKYYDNPKHIRLKRM